MKITNAILALLFLWFAYVQWNDPDPLKWILLYGFISILSTLAVFKYYNKYILLVGVAICGLGLVFLLPDFIFWLQNGTPSITSSMKAEAPHIELVREFLGLVICLAALGWHWKGMKRVPRA